MRSIVRFMAQRYADSCVPTILIYEDLRQTSTLRSFNQDLFAVHDVQSLCGFLYAAALQVVDGIALLNL